MIGRHGAGHAARAGGRRIVLRTLTDDDYEAWFEVRARCRRLARPLGAPPDGRPAARRGPGQLRGPLRASRARAPDGERLRVRDLRRRSGSSGEITLSSIQRGPFQNAFVGYWVDEAMAGRGWRPRHVVVRCVSPSRLGLHRVEIAIVPRNRASRRVVEKLGLREEGVAVRYPGDRRALGGPRPLRHDRRGVDGPRRRASLRHAGSARD